MSTPGPGPEAAPLLTIGAVAAITGRSTSAIRYYEQIGLLPEPVRVGGQRRYDQVTVRTLAVIETGQRAGLALDEIKVLLAASPGDPAAVERLREVASRKLPGVVARIERRELVRGWLELASRCECPDLGQCPLFDDPALPGGAGAKRPSARAGLSAVCRWGPGPFVPGRTGGRRRAALLHGRRAAGKMATRKRDEEWLCMPRSV